MRSSRSLLQFIAIAGLMLFCPNSYSTGVHAQGTTAANPSASLIVSGDVKTPLSLSLADLQHQPRTTLKATNEHQDGKEENYEGVSLAALLKQAGAPQLRGATMATYVLAEGSDGYRVIFSLAELDSGFEDSEILVADTLNGAPLGDKIGPLRLVVPHDKRPARWVRMLQSIKVVTVPKP
jgi:DMSO/TMAO reductase YedYZ molybdopterin-dependent catalytic subunit